MNTWRSVFVYAVCFLFAVARSGALDPARHISQYGHTAWRVLDGSVASTGLMTQTADGYIWMGMSTGLVRFDGVRFVPYVPPKGRSFPSRNFTVLLGSRDGSLWVGTSGGLSRLKDGQLQNFTKPSERSGIGNIIEDHAGKIWVTRYRVPEGEGPLCQVVDRGLRCYGKADGIPLRYGLGLAEDSHGDFWLGSTVVCRWKPGSSCTTFFDDAMKGRSVGDGVISVVVGPSGKVWASIDGVGPQLGVRYFSDGKWDKYAVPGFDGSTIRSHALFIDRNKCLWIGTENDGLYRIHHGVADHYGSADGLSGHSVSQFYEDREGNLWVMTDGGVDMFRDTPVVTFSMSEGLTSSDLHSVLASRDGSVWIGGSGAADRLREGRNQPLLAGRGLPGQDVFGLHEDHAGAMWLGISRDLYLYDQGQFQRITDQNGVSLGGDRSEISAITEDANRNIWALSQRALFRVANNQVQESISLSGDLLPAYFLAPDTKGGLWLATRAAGMLAHYQNGKFQTKSLKDGETPVSISGLAADGEDPLLVPTLSGLYRWNGSGWTVLDSRNGLPCNQIFSVLKDNHHSLWLYAQCGLLRVDASELAKWRQQPESQLVFRIFDTRDGAHPGSRYSYQPLASKAPDGKLWFVNGVVAQMIDPDHLNENHVPPPIHIEEVVVGDKSYPPASHLHLPPLTQDLEIDYTALSFSVPQKVQFRYMLEGHDTDWQGPVTRRQAFYTNLGPGPYRFRVMASNNDGVWNETEAAIDFVVAPTFYQTTWFMMLCAIAAAGLFWSLYLLRVRRATAQIHARLGAQMEERERIARELHDTLLQGFHGLVLRFQAVLKKMPAHDPVRGMMESVLDRADEVLLEGRNRVRDLRQQTITGNELPDMLTRWGEELAQDYTARFSLAIVGTPQSLDPTVHNETYKIGREAMTNAFKHAQASRVEADVLYDNDNLRLRVRDNGVGIDQKILNNGRPGHWGMAGMRERAQKIGGELKIWSHSDAGTEIDLTIPATVAYPLNRKRSRWHWIKRLGRIGN